MSEKLKEMLGSVRFWYAVALSVAYFLEQYGLVPNAVANAIQIFSILGIGVRTVDKGINKF